MYFDPSYAFAGMRRKRRKRNTDNDMDIFEKFIMFQEWLNSMKEKDKPKDDKKKDEPKKVDTTGLAMFLMVISFFLGQMSLLYLMANMPK